MAGGRGNNKQSGNLDRIHQWLRCHQLYASVKPELPSSEKFKKHQRIEKSRIVAKSLNDLQHNILSIFTDSLYCDLNIIHGYNIIRTNQCIIKTRAPHFYKVLKPYFVYINNHIDCIIDKLEIFHHIEGFVRLLYSNSNFSKEEQLLVEDILSTYTSKPVNASSDNKVLDINKRYVDCATQDCRSKGIDSARNVREYATVDISPTVSDMADSGLETGSVSPHDNTTSENSSTDFEELQVTEYTSRNDELDKIRARRIQNKEQKIVTDNERYNSSNSYNSACHIKELGESGLTECSSNDHSATCCSFDSEQPQLDSSSSSTDNAQKGKSHMEEIFQYENQVLSDPFYESDCGSDENESFEFINVGNASSTSTDVEKSSVKGETAEKSQDEKMCHSSYSQVENAQPENANHEISHDTRNQKSSCNTSNYYFIDASTLNDEVEVPTSNIPKNHCYDEKLQPYTSFTSKYVASTSNDFTEEQCYKFTPLKTTNLQTGHERIAEFERELKLTEYLEPLADTRKLRRTDSVSDDKVNTETNKESLAVEIKEADSGESAHPSPCPDNNKNISNDRHAITRVNNDNDSNVAVESTKEGNEKKDDKDANLADDTRRPSLIRRNTFELDSNDEKLSVLRQEYERRQGNLVFQNAIPQYSGHRVDGDSCFNPPEEPSIPISNVLNKFTVDVQIPSSSQYHTMPYLSLDNEKYEINQTPPESNILLQSSSKTNMIYPVTKSASDEVVMDYQTDLDNDSSNCSNSLPVTLSCILEKDSRTDTLKKTKCDETMPIISGGVSTSDYSKPTDSPTVRRKTESTPIVSGGSVIMSEPEVRMRPTRMSSSMTAWVVDMSDCNKNESKLLNNTHTGMSQSFSTSECVKKPVRKISNHEKHGSLGFFVNLKDMDCKPVVQQQNYSSEKKEQNGCSKSYCEFYVDMSSTSTSSNAPKNKKLEVEESIVKHEKPSESNDKKNIFSMFIDLSDPPKNRETTVQTSHRRSFSTFSEKQIETKLDDTNSSENSIATRADQSTSEQKCIREKAKPSVFMYIESDSPVVRRRTLSSSRPAFKRHSWNVDKTQSVNNNGQVAKELMFRREHKRAHSLSVDRGDLKKLQAKPSSSSHSLSDTTKPEFVAQKNSKLLQEGNNGPSNMDTSSEDVFEFDVRDTPPNSHVEVINEELRVSIKEHGYTELKVERNGENLNANDVKVYEDEYSETSAWEKTCTESTEGQTRKSETFDISSGSGPSPDSDNHDYELSELLNGEVPNINRSQVVPAVGSKISETHKSLNETIKKIESELKSPDYVKPETEYGNHNVISKKNERIIGHAVKSSSSNFVRLSDLDKTPVTSHSTDVLTVKEDKRYRMCNSIPETSWIESKLVMSRTNGSVRPLPRKFTSVMSTSLPSKQKSPLEELTGEYDGEGIISESDLSSMQSSMGRSGAEGSTEETETSSLAGSRPYNRLGEDLLRMFLEEINPDVTIDVAGRRIRAHKCILSSRCQYFAAILSGGWIESVGNVIPLPGYSYDVVHFALCHIYSGESNIPDSINIIELATLADMLCLEGLKEIIGYTLKVKYCHLFHKPCQICAVGVLECMSLAAAYGLDEVYRKSLRWVTRHFVRIWPCKAFATLPKELMAKCYHQHIVHMSTDNVLQTMMDCDKLLATLPNVRWAEPVFRMVSNLLETSVKFLSDNFSGVLGNENFQSLGRELTWNISRLEDNFLGAAERLPPEQACKSYSKLHKMLTSAQQDEVQDKIKWGPLFIDFLKKIQSRVEKCLVRDAARAARTTTWLKMDLELRRRIQELACLVILPNETTKRQSRHSNFIKESRPASSRSTITNRSLDLKRVKMVISEHNHKTLKQMAAAQQQQPKKVFNKPKSDPLERKMQTDKQTTADTNNRPKSWPNKLEVKSRYLEPRNKSVPKETTQPVHQEKVMVQQRRKIMISSSDSSRTSSPAMKRATDKKPLAKIKLPIKKDVKALSSDSLTESTASRTNTKKDSISKSCGITRPESPSFKQKSTEIGLSVDSLAESKNKPTTVKKKTSKMDTSMSTDSLMTEITTTPKSNTSNKFSPTLGKTTNKAQPYDKGAKKSSPPMQQRSPLTATRRPRRSLESSTAASRSRAAAISAYHLRRNLLDAAKTPDIPSKSLNNVPCKLVSTRPITQSTINHPNVMREKKEGVPNQQGSESPSKRSSPKSSGTNKINKSTVTNKRATSTKISNDEKAKNKCHNGEVPKQPTVGSRSGTFLKDEPTILKKADIKSSQINT